MSTWSLLNSLGVVGVWSLIGYMVLSRKLVWHADMAEVKAERDHWREIALRGLGVAEQTIDHAEVLVKATADESSTP